MKTFTVKLFDDQKIEIKADSVDCVDGVLCFYGVRSPTEPLAVFNDFIYVFSDDATITFFSDEKPYDDMADYGRE